MSRPSRIRWLERAREDLCAEVVRDHPVAKVPYTRTVRTRTATPRVELLTRERRPESLSTVLRVCRNLADNPTLRADISAWLQAAEKAEAVLAGRAGDTERERQP